LQQYLQIKLAFVILVNDYSNIANWRLHCGNLAADWQYYCNIANFAK